MHYRCANCEEVYALERLHERGSGRTVAPFCPFCGAESPARVNVITAALSTGAGSRSTDG